ncbi:MAG: hypothetical protein RJA70_1952 [Pseudomonadota bacterium]|jgi:tRNA 2-thiocytidine biosynthesis protein TtcA
MDPAHYLKQQLKRTCHRYGLLKPGDHVMVAVSGGKDSYTLLVLLDELTRSLPYEVRLTAVHLDQQQPGYDGKPLQDWLSQFSVPFEILSEDTFSVVTTHLKEGSTYCSMCSRLRRGILYSAAERLGCNKIALGHHREDTLETFLMNLLYSGKLQAMPASYTTDDGRFQVIRPLLECAEADIALFAKERAFPILPCNLCGSQSGLKRERMSELLESLGQEIPNVKGIMLAALGNVMPTHLLDPSLHDAWQARPPEVRPSSPAASKERRSAALPILSRTAGEAGQAPTPRRLPVLGNSQDGSP